MSSLKKMKQEYDAIPIPEELAARVEREIGKSREKQPRPSRFGKMLRFAGAAAAAVGVVFTLALNTIPAFALEAAQLPVIGSLARVLTFRSYEAEQNDILISVEVPSIEMIEKDTGIQLEEINREILDRCKQYADEALARAEEYRTAFLATGGTPEEWAAHNVKITVNYEILHQDGDFLSFVVRGSENWSNAGAVSQYYNLDLHSGGEVTLKDLLGDDYEAVANRSIRQQIEEREQAGAVFFPEDAGGFSGITEAAKFYINASHNPVIVFDRYEIANGAAGEITFEIPRDTQTLEALLGEDYVTILTETITMQMENRMEKNPEVSYYPVAEQAPLSDYVEIRTGTAFEIDPEGYLVITFPAGTVTDKLHGIQTFRVQRIEEFRQ